MELVGFDINKIVSLFLASSHGGKLHVPTAVQRLVERYGFAGYPKTIEEFTSDRISFRLGVFNGVTIDELNVYPDGIVVTAKADTDALDAFEADICDWMESALNLKRIETHAISKVYESHVIIKSGSALLAALDSLGSAAQLLHRSLKSRTKIDAKFVPFGIGLAVDHATLTGLKPIAFRVERKASAPFDANLYLSTAPVPTKDHLKILDLLEKSG